ncbi:MAG TPA: VOC family protein [Streptomyces sp.]
MSRHLQITFDAHEPRSLAAFWAEALGYVVPAPPGVELPDGADVWEAWHEFLAKAGVPEEERESKAAIEDPDGHGPRVFFQRVPEGKAAKNRVHLDVRAAPGLEGDERTAALETEAGRLVALGATVLRRYPAQPPMSGGWVVMADPEGNEFCLD